MDMLEGKSCVTVFDAFHPAVAFLYFTALLVLCMTALHPVLTTLFLLGSFVSALRFLGPRVVAKGLLWQIPLFLIIALANPLFTQMGSTELFRLGPRAFYLESLLYGMCMGGMLVSVVEWFAVATAVLDSDKMMALFGRALPTLGLMMSMIARLVPDFVRRGRSISAVQQACSAAKPPSGTQRLAEHVRASSVLMGWSMENSLETADAMRARGWGAVPRRSNYVRYRFAARDAAVAVMLLAFAGIVGFLCFTACSQFSFYPQISMLVPWWGYIPCALFVLLAPAAQLLDDARWRAVERSC